MFEQMYDLNLKYFKELTMYIIAGKKALDKARGEQLEVLRQKAEMTQMQEDVENYNKYVTEVNGEKKIKRSILECGNIGVETEAQDIQFNSPDLFVD